MEGGVDRLDGKRKHNQAAEGLNAINDDGDVRRRDALVSVATAPPHMLPAGLCYVATSDGDPAAESITFPTDRNPAFAGEKRIYIGCEDQFDGFDVRWLTDNTTPTQHIRAKLSYWNGAIWVAVPWFLDHTILYGSNPTETLGTEGRMSWRKADLTGWTAHSTSVTGVSLVVTAFYIRIDLVEGARSDVATTAVTVTTNSATATVGAGHGVVVGDWVESINHTTNTGAEVQVTAVAATSVVYPLTAGDGALADGVGSLLHRKSVSLLGPSAVTRPGIRCFELEPVTGIHPTNIRGEQLVLATAGRPPESAVEAGETIEVVRGNQERELLLGGPEYTEDNESQAGGPESPTTFEGSGTYGQPAWPVNEDRAYGGAWATHAASPGTHGVASKLQKDRRDFNWITDPLWVPATTEAPYSEFRGGLLVHIGITMFDSAANANGRTTLTLQSPYVTVAAKRYRHCRLRCITKGGGGTPLGEEREVYFSEGLVLKLYPAFSVAPDGNNEFILSGPHARMKVQGPTDGDDRKYEVDFNDEHTVGVSAQPYAPAADATIVDKPVHWRLRSEPRFSVEHGEQWSFTTDPQRGRVLACNDRTPIHVFDGRSLRRHIAGVNDAAARRFQVHVSTYARDEGLSDVDVNAYTKLARIPPRGRYIWSYRGAIFVANLPGYPDGIRHSALNGSNHVWPLLYNGRVRDTYNSPITGMRTLGDRLIIFTSYGFFESTGFSRAGRMGFRPVYQGSGFLGHDSVDQVRGSLVGPGTDSLYAFDGVRSRAIWNGGWERVFDGGINTEELDHAVGACWPQKNLYMLALSPPGSTDNTLMLVWDYKRNALWPWSLNHAITAMKLQRTPQGQETMVFGTKDGYLQVMTDALTEDGKAIDGYVRSAPFHPYRGQQASLQALRLTLGTIREDQTLNIKSFVGKQGSAKSTAAVQLEASGHHYAGPTGAALLGPTGSALTGDSQYLTRRVNLPRGTIGHVVQFEVGGTERWRLRDASLICRRQGVRGR